MAQCNDGHNSSWRADVKPLWQLVRVASITNAWAGATAGRSAAVALCLQVAVHHLAADDLSTQVHLVLFTLQLHSHWQQQQEWCNDSGIVSLLGGLGYELSKFNLGGSLISLLFYKSVVFSGSIWFMPNFSTYGVSLSPLFLGYYSLRISDLGWAERLGRQGIYWWCRW